MAEPKLHTVAPAQAGQATRIYIFKGYERLWHWMQAILISLMLVTGFEIHGAYQLLGFDAAVRLHTLAAWILIVLWLFTLFWHVTTGEWRQYSPTTTKIGAMMKFYASGIFRGEEHPYEITAAKKHNPLQRMTYLGLLVVVLPLVWISGLLYMFRAYWPALGLESVLSLYWVAVAHTAGAFMILFFLIMHLYLITTGHTVGSQLKAMITGWEELPGAGERKA